MSLAYKAAQFANVHVPEAKLLYGFRKTPKNHIQFKKFRNIDEGKLYSVDREVIELKPPTPIEEEEESEEDDEEEEEEIHAPAKLGYNDIGYYPSKYPKAPFEIQCYEHAEEGPCHDPLTLPDIGCCGFRPGKIEYEKIVEKPDCAKEHEHYES